MRPVYLFGIRLSDLQGISRGGGRLPDGWCYALVDGRSDPVPIKVDYEEALKKLDELR